MNLVSQCVKSYNKLSPSGSRLPDTSEKIVMHYLCINDNLLLSKRRKKYFMALNCKPFRTSPLIATPAVVRKAGSSTQSTANCMFSVETTDEDSCNIPGNLLVKLIDDTAFDNSMAYEEEFDAPLEGQRQEFYILFCENTLFCNSQCWSFSLLKPQLCPFRAFLNPPLCTLALLSL